MENRIYKLCEDVLQITNEEIAEIREIAKGQKNYFNPLKMATMGWQKELGEHNEKVLEALINLKNAVAECTDIKKPE